MKNIFEYLINKSTTSRKNVSAEEASKICQKLYDELTKSKYLLKFDANSPEGSIKWMNIKDNGWWKEDINQCFKSIKYDLNKDYIFKMSVWDNGVNEFTDNPKHSQGVIAYHANNTDFKYWILVIDNICYLSSTQRRSYMSGKLIGKIYKFEI